MSLSLQKRALKCGALEQLRILNACTALEVEIALHGLLKIHLVLLVTTHHVCVLDLQTVPLALDSLLRTS